METFEAVPMSIKSPYEKEAIALREELAELRGKMSELDEEKKKLLGLPKNKSFLGW